MDSRTQGFPAEHLDLKLTHLDWNPEVTLIHFQGQYLTICELDYNILQRKIENVPKTTAAVDIGDFCLVEDLTSARWYRGRVQNSNKDLFDVFLIDHGNVLSVSAANISSCSNDLFSLPPKIVCGFLANVLLLQSCPNSMVEQYFSTLIGRNVTGYINAMLPHKVLLLETPDINNDLVCHGFGRHVDTDTFLLLVQMVTEVPLKRNIAPAPDLLIQKPKVQEFSFRPSDFQGYNDILSYSGTRLSCGTCTKVRVTAAVNPRLFYCQMVSMEKDLWEMSKKLTAVCEYKTKESNQNTPENLGLLCAVKGKDGKWYRGFVQFLPVNSQVRVLFADYGFYESVNIENIHRLPPGFDSTPFTVFPCSLFSLTDQGETVKAQQLIFLKAGLLGRVLDVEIRNFDDEHQLYSIKVTGAEDNQKKEAEPIQDCPKIKVESVSETEELGGFLYHETIICETMSKTLETEHVQVDSAFVGYVDYVQNPHHFWIHTQKRNDDFEEMMTKMADHFRQLKLHEDVLLSPLPGTLCCAVYEKDMHFYRAVVKDILEHGAEVLFIDFGNIEKVPYMLIKKIPKEFATKSAFAFCCSLVNVVPLDEIWTSTTCDFFKRAVSNKALLVQVVQIRKNKVVVDLCEMRGEGSQSITELMISTKQAEYWNNIRRKPVVENNLVTEKHRRPRSSVTSDVDRKTEQLEDCKEEDKMCKSETEIAQAPVCFKTLSIKPGCEFAVCCSYITTPSDFWCRYLDKVPALEQLMDKVQLYYSTHTVAFHSEDSCCVAKSPQDGRWYRAFITKKQKSSSRVILVDYGHTIQIQDHSLQGIMPEHLFLERQAFRCSLYDLIGTSDPKDSGSWSLEACDLLKDFVCNSTCGLRCKVVSQLNMNNKGLCNVVDLYNTRSQQSLAHLLLEQGLAREVTVSTKELSTEFFPESFVFSSYDLGSGNEEEVYVTHVSSQWEIYCHLERNIDIIEELEKKISDESVKMMQASTKAVVGKLCLAKYFDGKWYRGLVHPVLSPLHLSVFFVDYGNSKISEKAQVMFIPRNCAYLLHTPMQALRCNLASVSKKELYADVKDWLENTVLNKKVRALIVGKNEDGSFDVELFDGEVNVNKKVKELIASLSPKPKTVVSMEIIGLKKKCENPHRKNTNVLVKHKRHCEKQLSNCSTSSAQRRCHVVSAPHKNTKNYVHGKDQTSYAEVKQQNEKRTKNSVPLKLQKHLQVEQKRKYCDTNKKSEQIQFTERTKMPQLSCLPDVKLTKGFRAVCLISHIDSVNSFFLQLSEDEPAISKMAKDVNSGVFKDSLNTTTSLSINDLVLAVYEEDGALYRSVVKDHERNSCFKVEFVDYGNSAVMGKDKMYSISKEFLSQPRFSIPCCLLNTDTYKNDTSFSDAVMEKPLMVDFVRQDGTHWEVEIEIVGQAIGPSFPIEAAVESNTKTRVEVASPPSSFEIEEKNCKILSVLSDGSFYVRPNRTSELLSGLESCIADKIHKCEIVAEKDVKQGLKCLVQVHKNERWHRAVVESVRQGKCQVLLMDHGITDDISIFSIRQQGSDLTKIPNLAVLCRMNCFGFGDREGADKSLCETIEPMIGNEVNIMFLCYSKVDKLWKVEIIMNGLFLICRTSPQQNNEAMLSPAETKSENVEGKSNLDTSEPQQLAFDPVEIDKAYSGFAAAVTTPFEFCVVLENSLLVMNKVSIMLDGLPEMMPPLPEAHLVSGSGCLLKSDTKNKWCRAEIVHSDTTKILNLVDHGHYECISSEDCVKLKMLPVEMTVLPKVMYPCILRAVKPVRADGQWTDEATLYFQRCLHQKNLKIFFREFVSKTQWKVDILADDVHVAKDLVDAGHAILYTTASDKVKQP
uniref:Tudor domain-containing protein n=1 Tax=Mola mola TaxID=94237 RepID=A0A3Q3X5N4_MOLML